MTRATHDDDEAVKALVDALLAEHALVEVPADAPVAPPRPDRTEMPRRSWMDQVGRAKTAR